MACGAPLAAGGITEARARKIVTVLFVDIADSTALGEKLDPESFRRLIAGYAAEVSSVVAHHGGTVEKFAGDAVMAVFGVPVVHEDDAVRAVRAASEIRGVIDKLNEEIEPAWGVRIAVRTGVNTGEVVSGDPTSAEALVSGDPVNLAAKLEEAAPPGHILIGDATYRLVRDAVRVERATVLLKARDEPLPAYDVIEVVPDAPGHARQLQSPLVGRDHELRRVIDEFEVARRERRCRLLTLVGAAGVGKSRLVKEAITRIKPRATILQGRCLPYGDGITFWPVVEAVKQAVGILEGDTADDVAMKLRRSLPQGEDTRLASDPLLQVMGLTDSQASTGEIFWAVRTLFHGIVADRPLVVVFDDIHWAEPTFLELVQSIAEWNARIPIFLICTARPDLLDEHPDWEGLDNDSKLVLESLSDLDSEVLIRNLLGGPDLDEELAAAIIDSAGGTPLFVEEFVRMLVDEGLVQAQGGRWVATADISALRMPGTIDALLSARVERLREDEREVLTRGAVSGKEFYKGALARLVSRDTARHLDELLDRLVARELIQQKSNFAGEPAYRFRHILIQDVAYRSLPKQLRARLHEQFAGWLEWNPSVRFGEYEEIVGYHLERSYRYREELGAIDEHARSLAESASLRLASAGRRALQRGDLPAAATLLQRAAAPLEKNDERRNDLQLDLTTAWFALGEGDRADSLLRELETSAGEVGDKRTEARAKVLQYGLHLDREPTAEWTETARRDSDRFIAIFEEYEDYLALARVYRMLGQCEWNEYKLANASTFYEKALGYARRSGDPLEIARNLINVSTAMLWGPARAGDALRWCDRALEGTRSNRWLQVSLGLRSIALRGILGELDDARAGISSAITQLQELSLPQSVLTAHEIGGYVELFGHNPTLAEDHLRKGLEMARDLGDPGAVATFSGHLARALLDQKVVDEADRLLDEAFAVGGDAAELAVWACRRARVLAAQGRVEEAESLARQSVAMLEGTDSWPLLAEAFDSLAETLRAAGQPEEGDEYASRADRIYEAKGVALQ